MNLVSLILEIDSTDANSNAGLSEALGEQNIFVLQNQVQDLQERLSQLQVITWTQHLVLLLGQLCKSKLHMNEMGSYSC